MGAVRLLRDVVAVARERNLTFLAAGIVYYAFTSIPPLVLVVLAVGTAVGEEWFVTALVSRASGLLSAPGEQLVEEMLSSEDGRVGAGTVGFVVLAWSALKLFRGLAIAFEELYGGGDDSLGGQVRDAVLVLLATAAVATLMVASGTVLAVPSFVPVPYPNVVGAAVLVVGLSLVFLPVYYVLPPVEMSLGKALPGVVVAAVGWSALQVLFHLYAANASTYAAYGVVGVVLLFVTWLYFAGIVLLAGATVNAVVGGDTAPGEPTETAPDSPRPAAADGSGRP
jgi:membrane protein